MKLCKKCRDEFTDRQIHGWTDPSFSHCHHEEEPEGCELCKKKIFEDKEKYEKILIPTIAKFCPNCGRKL